MGQDEARAAWQVTKFDITVGLGQTERAMNATAILNGVNIGRGAGSTFTFRINSKATVKSVTVGGASASLRSVPETRGGLQRVTVTLPGSVAPNGTTSLTINYSLPVESNTGLAAISPIGSQFLPLSFWYPAPNTPFALRGADTAPFVLSVNGGDVLSSGNERTATAGGGTVYEQQLNGQPFFVQGSWDRVDGSGAAKGVSAFLPKGATAEERKQGESLVGLAAAARAFYSTLLGPGPDVPIRLIAVRRGSGFNDCGTVLIETGAFRRSRIDSATALLISEAVGRLWIGGQTPVRAEGGGLLRDGLVRFLSSLFLEQQFGREAALTELQRERLAFSSVVKRDAPLAMTTPLDDTYFSSVPNKGAMVWRLIDRRMGHEVFITTIKAALLAGKTDVNGLTLAALRAALGERGGAPVKTLLEQQVDQVTDMDLMVGVPQQRGGDWVSALRNIGATDAAVTVVATTDQGKQLPVEATIPARNFGEAVFKTTARVVRVEIDPDKLYPQIDYANDVAPRGRDLTEALGEAARQFAAQDYVRAETTAREILTFAPRTPEARMILGRALLGENRLDEAEKVFRSALEEALPSPASLAWSNIGLAEIALKRGQAAEAAKRFGDAVRTDAEYASSLAARAGRIRAEAAASNSSPIDDSAKAFIAQLDQIITSAKKSDLESRVISGELVRFVSGIVGTQPEIWQTRVLRTEQLDATLLAADVNITARELGQDRTGTAVLILARTGGGWKLAGIDLFEVH